jgi:hypothetical protein
MMLRMPKARRRKKKMRKVLMKNLFIITEADVIFSFDFSDVFLFIFMNYNTNGTKLAFVQPNVNYSFLLKYFMIALRCVINDTGRTLFLLRNISLILKQRFQTFGLMIIVSTPWISSLI